MVLASLVCCAVLGLDGCKGEQIGPSGAEVYGTIIGAGAAIALGTYAAVEIHKSHHTVKGCVTPGGSGLQLQAEGNNKTWTLAGNTADVKAGDLVRLHGEKEKKAKGSSDQTFSVEKVSKDYGPCKLHP